MIQRTPRSQNTAEGGRKRRSRDALSKFIFPRQLIGECWRSEGEEKEYYVADIVYSRAFRDTCLYCIPYDESIQHNTTPHSTNLIVHKDKETFNYDYVRNRVEPVSYTHLTLPTTPYV